MNHIGRLMLAGGIAVAATAPMAHAADFLMTSPAFKDATPMAAKNAGDRKDNPNCVGQNVSPPLQWSGAPANTKSFVLLMFDPEGRNGLGVSHWVAYGIAPTVTGFAEGEVTKDSDKYVGGKSQMGVGHYSGPCTPGDTGYHHYTFTLIATDLDTTALKPGLTRDEVFAALNGHTLKATGLVGLFVKPGAAH